MKTPDPKVVARRRYSLGDLANIVMLAIALLGLWGAVVTVIVGVTSRALWD